jgi:dTDP-4-amino-4,6-dideoxygalactose transaminase
MVRYPYSRPDITDADIKMVTSVLAGENQYLTQGMHLSCFESELAERFGAKFAVVCNSGTAALHMAYKGLGVGPDAGVVTSAVTFLATANAARMCNAPVAFADVDPNTGNVSADTMAKAIERADFPVKVLAPVHLGGRPCDMVALRDLAAANGCALVEDASHAPGAVYRDHDQTTFQIGACAHSDAATFSFHAIKHVAMGEGGAVLTNDADVAERAALLRNHGMIRNPDEWIAQSDPDTPWYYEMHDIGWNYRADEMTCALGRSQLRRFGESNENRRALANLYYDTLDQVGALTLPERPKVEDEHAWHLFAAKIDFDEIGRSRGAVMRSLSELGIGTQVHYIPLYRQPYYTGLEIQDFPGAEQYYANTLSLPMYNQLGAEDIDCISAIVAAELSAN